MKKGPRKTVSVSMPPELYEIIKRLAEEEVRSVPGYIRVVLRDHLEEKTPSRRSGEAPLPKELSAEG